MGHIILFSTDPIQGILVSSEYFSVLDRCTESLSLHCMQCSLPLIGQILSSARVRCLPARMLNTSFARFSLHIRCMHSGMMAVWPRPDFYCSTFSICLFLVITTRLFDLPMCPDV